MKKQRGVFEKEPGSNVWWICYFDADGRKRREKVGRKSAAIKLYQKRKTDSMEGRKLPDLRARKVTFGELASDALEYSKVHKISYAHDSYRMAKLKERFKDRLAETIAPFEFERWIAEHKDWKPATANRYRALLSLTYRLGIQNRKVLQNPARLMQHRRENNSRIRWLTFEEEKNLRRAVEKAGPGHLAELDVAIHTGLRRGEQYGLTWDYVDLERQLLTVQLTKNGETRHIPVNSTALAALLILKRHSGASERVFNTVGPRRWFEPAVRTAGLVGFTWHCLRHTFASRLVMAGVDLRTVQELLGHKTIAMTCRYAHLAPAHKLAAVERLTWESGDSSCLSDTTTDTTHAEIKPADGTNIH
jgi:site-specific recombinase XerD